MNEKEALDIIAAHAACTIVGGCDLCPLYAQEREKPEQRGLCQEKTAPDKLREALTVLRGRKEQ